MASKTDEALTQVDTEDRRGNNWPAQNCWHILAHDVVLRGQEKSRPRILKDMWFNKNNRLISYTENSVEAEDKVCAVALPTSAKGTKATAP